MYDGYLLTNTRSNEHYLLSLCIWFQSLSYMIQNQVGTSPILLPPPPPPPPPLSLSVCVQAEKQCRAAEVKVLPVGTRGNFCPLLTHASGRRLPFLCSMRGGVRYEYDVRALVHGAGSKGH